MRTPAPLAAVLVLALLLALLPASSAEADDPVCIESGLLDRGPGDLVARSVEILRRSGHDPARYRLELRLEPAGPPDPGAARQAVVAFLPRDASARFDPPLLVGPANPCEVAWIWEPERLTAWQRDAVDRAVRAHREAGAAPSAPLDDVTVTETAEALRVRLRLGRPPDVLRVEVLLAKPGLELIGYSRESAR